MATRGGPSACRRPPWRRHQRRRLTGGAAAARARLLRAWAAAGVAGARALIVLILGATAAAARCRCKGDAPTRCWCAALALLIALPVVAILAALPLVVAAVTNAACAAEPTLLQTNLAPLPNISFGGGHNVSLADAVPLALHCGEPGYPSDAVAILGLSDIVSRTADADALTSELLQKLGVFNATAIATLESAIAELPEAAAALADGGAPDGDFNAAAAADLATTLDAFLNGGPNVTVPLPADATDVQGFVVWYGGQPDAQNEADNTAIRKALADATVAAAAANVSLIAANATAAAAAPAVAALGSALVAAREGLRRRPPRRRGARCNAEGGGRRGFARGEGERMRLGGRAPRAGAREHLRRCASRARDALARARVRVRPRRRSRCAPPSRRGRTRSGRSATRA